jgi:hypothetical protein
VPCIGARLVSASAGAGPSLSMRVLHCCVASPPKQMPDADGALVSFRGGTLHQQTPLRPQRWAMMEMARAAAGRP